MVYQPENDTSACEPPDDVFAELAPELRAMIERRTSFSDYPAGYLFFTPEERTQRLLFVKSGRVRLYKLSPEGRSLTLFVLERQAVFGEAALLGDRPHDCFAEALSDCRVGALPSDEVRELMIGNPSVALRMMDVIARRLRALERKLADIAFKSVPQRLAAILLSLADCGIEQAVSPPAVIRYTHQQLAEMLGSYRETVTKAVGEFREAGLIRITDEAIVLLDVGRLRGLAGR
ncbi:MAG: Crp/Fnr family transcriptional regulator [Roseiflexaceae bacterium]|nr:Crp/Fnr family transcriptional regulator [Roseiflexaceae bacterium]